MGVGSQEVRFEQALSPEVDKNGSQVVRFQHFLALGPEVDKMRPRRSDFSIVWPWVQKSTKCVPGNPILAFSGLGSRSRQSGSQEIGVQHFLALVPEVDKTGPRKSEFSIFWPWVQKSTKWAPRGPILAISHALGGGRYRN